MATEMLNARRDDLLSPADVARLFGIEVATLALWRQRGRPALPFIRLGAGRSSPIRYRAADVEAFLAENSATSTAEFRTAAAV